MSRLLLVGLLLLAAACAPARAPLPTPNAADHRLSVTSNDWHTRIVVAVADIADEMLPERADLAPAGWLAIGWGDHDYYPMRDPPRRLAVKAALLPSDSVLHLIPLAAPPRSFPGFEVLEIEIGGPGMQRMLQAIDAEIDRRGEPRAPVAAPGLYPESLFYPATGTFHIFNTCNTWVARQLQLAGLPIRAAGVITAEDLMRQLRVLPEVSVAGG
jgi:uncharacterized protein (TIGR02117 family)